MSSFEADRYLRGIKIMQRLIHLTAIAVLVLIVGIVIAMAQTPMPRTVPFNDADGKQIGTATFSGKHIYLRDAKGELFAQIIIEADGTRKMLDPHGKVLDEIRGEIAHGAQ